MHTECTYTHTTILWHALTYFYLANLRLVVKRWEEKPPGVCHLLLVPNLLSSRAQGSTWSISGVFDGDCAGVFWSKVSWIVELVFVDGRESWCLRHREESNGVGTGLFYHWSASFFLSTKPCWLPENMTNSTIIYQDMIAVNKLRLMSIHIYLYYASFAKFFISIWKKMQTI